MFLKNQQVGKYRIEKSLGNGGFGAVFLAEDTLIGKKVAIKVPHRQSEDIEAMVARLEVLPFDTKAAYHFGQIRATLYRLGKPIGPYDMMIAGQARALGLTLVTNNVKEFERVPGLLLEDWSQL